MSLPVSRDVIFAALSQVPSATLNDIQDMIILSAAQFSDGVLAPGARLTEPDVQPDTATLFCSGMGGAPFPSATVVRGVRNLPGWIVQSVGGTIDGVAPQTLQYHLAADEVALQCANNTSGNDRWDILQVKLARSTTLPQRVLLTASLKQGTPAGSPSEPTPDAGYVKLAAMKVTNGMGSAFFPVASLRDWRMPLGLRVVDVLGRDWARQDALGTEWGRGAGYGVIVSDGVASRAAYAIAPCGPMSRLVAVGLLAGNSNSYTGQQANVRPFDLAASAPGAVVTGLISLVTASAGVVYKEATVLDPPIWGDGSAAGYANRITPPSTAFKRAALEYLSQSALLDTVAAARFYIAG